MAAVWTEDHGIGVALRVGWDLALAVGANEELFFRAHGVPFK